MQNEPLVREVLLNASAERAWKAITDEHDMKKWYFHLPGFRAEVGYEFQFTGGPAPDRQYVHLCKVTEVIPGKKLTYSWRYDGYEGISYVTFELFPEGNKTRLKLTHAGLETFPASNPDLARTNFEAGWTAIIEKGLPAFLG